MFHRAPDASKAALLALVEFLRRHKFDLLDCQQDTPHMRRFGARLLSRDDFLNRLDRSLERRDTLQGSWAQLAQELSVHDL
jgi:leucyl/phenylalanyl-tRNA--protein transferase